jgi:hypothetical protein
LPELCVINKLSRFVGCLTFFRDGPTGYRAK